MNHFNQLPHQPITLVKKDGQRIANRGVWGKRNSVLVFDRTFPVEVGDAIERELPSGIVEQFEIVDTGYQPSVRGAIPARYNIKLRRPSARPVPPPSVVNYYHNTGQVVAMGPHAQAIGNTLIGSDSRMRSATVTEEQVGAMKKHVILFLAANPRTSNPLRLAEECAEIQRELKMAPHRDDFQFESRWAVSIDEMMRHLNELAPTVIHFSGHGEGESGLLLQDEQGHPQPVSARALAMMVDTAARDARVVVLNACYSTAQAEVLRTKVECVVGMNGAIGDDAARAFAIRFYGALGNRRSIGNAVDQGVATLAAKQLPDEVLPCCVTRADVDKYQVVLDPS